MNEEKISEIFDQINELSSAWWELQNFEDIREYLNGNDNNNRDLIAELFDDLKSLYRGDWLKIPLCYVLS